MKINYKPEKLIWDETDYSQMGWHDNTIYSLAFDEENFKFLFDIDYIFQWVAPMEDENYKFWVSPVTLEFQNVSDMQFDFEILNSSYNWEISELIMEKIGRSPNNKFDEYKVNMDLLSGSISFGATGFKMYIKKLPILSEKYKLGINLRGGINFKKTT